MSITARRADARPGEDLGFIGLGVMGLDFSYSHSLTKQEGITLIRQAFDRGENFFDTAEMYGPFTNEEMVGGHSHPCETRS